MSYQARHNTNAVIRLSDNAIIGPENTEEWAEYQLWLSEGNTPEPYVIEVTPELTPEQKLQNAGLTVDELKTLLGLS